VVRRGGVKGERRRECVRCLGEVRLMLMRCAGRELSVVGLVVHTFRTMPMPMVCVSVRQRRGSMPLEVESGMQVRSGDVRAAECEAQSSAPCFPLLQGWVGVVLVER
jgi:hypothetical protein